MPTLVSADEFTVGWVCALPIELAAAAEMMDEEFADLPPCATDSNIYTLGRIGTHNVVAACMPAGQMGTNQAAIVASQMKSSFPSLRFNILVGIGGGAPDLEDGNDVDIRLGDVVISQPAGQHGGVVQYDFGKTGAGGVLARVGSLNASPEILLKALAKLRSNDFRGKTRITEHLAKYTDNPKFRSPGPEKDTLYMAASTHVPGPTCLKCRRDEVILREARESTDPVLFFGTIASGNQVIKDGKTRKRHSQELGGVLCFEMEAAGLMNNFPCIVVRGICDYADAHKNKKWQPYAAATAAAYAKELLLIVPSLESVAGDWQRSSSGGPLALEPAQRPMTEHQGATFNGPITGRNVLAGTRMSGNNNLTLS
ncbi:phosphorylase superfamily protein [Colletotrichum graminicola]|uniref:Phosphorylase superfamily protein n=1 Tax=Colletotrichum graminicola (strain M1.001 / M2 / FGSC 10212) TaxID=645133 RepID=E3QHI7_COLGM|nr:phosphorylase superfamily protein [Colletotrichum graminicola M1.001]EFQ30158.1 phosphorylase superfamily protein [Colletotrichum graminicola M1.001]WDK09183.1 phosphorylase superfamily protein [Colletotrichum graminicola]